MQAEPLTVPPPAASARAASEAPRRRGELALALQEAFTVAVRVRTNRQVAANAQAFRVHVKQLLEGAHRQAAHVGYDPDLVRLAIYAYIALLDESVLNSSQPMFADWPQQPLQEEVFGDHIAGENFFRHLGDLLGRQDSEDVADALEVYQLCMLLGFRGRYAADPGGLQSAQRAVQDKIHRIRGAVGPLAPMAGLPPGESVQAQRDPWIPRLVIAAAVALGLAVLFYLFFRLRLGSGVGDLEALTGQLVG
jgi:type VI secretion system protein ImpK